MRRCALLTVVLAGCAAPHAALPPPLAPFAAASRFVPDGMESFAFMPWGLSEPEELGRPRCTVWAGRAFQLPRTIESVGASRTIEIHDYGEQRIGDRLDKALEGKGATRVVVGGQACWRWFDRKARDGGQREFWYALADDRFVLVAWHPDVMVQALQQKGDLAAMLAPFGDLSFLPAPATYLILNLPRAPHPLMDEALVPTEPMVFVIAGDPQQLTVYSRSEPPPRCEEILASLWSTPHPPVTWVGAWRCQTDRLLDPQQVLWLQLPTLFGHAIVL